MTQAPAAPAATPAPVPTADPAVPPTATPQSILLSGLGGLAKSALPYVLAGGIGAGAMGIPSILNWLKPAAPAPAQPAASVQQGQVTIGINPVDGTLYDPNAPANPAPTAPATGTTTP